MITDVLYLHPVSSSIPSEEDHKTACREFLKRLVAHGLLAVDTRWSKEQDRWVLLFACKRLETL